MSYYGLEAKFVPIVTWPGKPTPEYQRKRAPFKATPASSIDLLKRELRFLSARHILIQMQCDESQIKRDGYPYADCKAGDGIVVTFDSPHGPLSYPCDNFKGWWNNLRAIALALEALRKVDRYGVTKRGEQYTGWKALPGAHTNGVMTYEQARRFILEHAGCDTDTPLTPFNYDNLYRIAAKKLHPDAGGTTELFQKLQEAKRVVDLGAR